MSVWLSRTMHSPKNGDIQKDQQAKQTVLQVRKLKVKLPSGIYNNTAIRIGIALWLVSIVSTRIELSGPFDTVSLVFIESGFTVVSRHIA